MAERKRSRPYKVDDVRFVHQNYAKMTAQEIADERGISRFQVSKIVSELRKQGVDLPKKTAKRTNPILQYLGELGVPAKSTEKPKGAGRKKSS